MNHNHVPRPAEDRAAWPDEQVAELLLLLPAWQAGELERLAHFRNLTIGQLTRLLIRDYLTDQCGPAPVCGPSDPREEEPRCRRS